MTEKLHLLQTHIVAPSQTTLLSPKSTPALLHHVPSKAETVEEEPYTIKCICGFADDDGNTIYCETCDTWQHIECFYPHNIEDAYAEDFAHSCADCKPRPLNPHHAHERQRQRRTKVNTEEVPERKPKRPPSKTHKKRSKPTDLQLNGHSGSDSTIKQPHESHHKKSKSTHRPNHSISSQPAKRSPSESQKTVNLHGHPPSPATTPPDLPADFEIHEYSSGFLSLYNDDRDMQIVQTNSFASLPISNALSLWTRDHDKLRHETGCEYDEVFQNLPGNIDAVKMTPVVEQKKHIVAPDTVLHWRYLSTPHAIDKDIPLIELNGQIGIQKEYCEDPGNRWAELSSPLPFVFFHPDLPLYIDTRKEGSLARYVRRSCKPNAVDRNIAPNEQITIPWDFRLPKPDSVRMLRLLGLRNEEAHHQPEFDPNQMEYYQHIASWLYQILSEYGGCACDLGPECAFARFHRTFISRSHSRSVSGSKKKPRKPKAHAVSPTSAGNPANSRAPSEGHLDDGGDNDSGSSRSKPPSRDMTPARQGSFDTLGILTEPTDRDKRKVAMVEDSFRRMEQQQPPRKKKRTSDGNTSGTTKARSSKSHSRGPNGTSERRYVDAGTNRSMSGSPASSVSPHTISRGRPQSSTHHWPSQSGRSSEGPRLEYRDASVQTDHVDGEWFSPQREVPKPKKRIVSLSKRLLESRHRLRADGEERRGSLAASPTSVTSAMVKMDLDSPSLKQTARFPSPEAVKETNLPVAPQHADVAITDTAMVDAPPVSPTDRRPSVVTTASSTSPASNTKSPDLRVQMPPPSMFHAPSVSASPVTPASTAGGIVQSPFPSSLPNPFGQASINGTAAQPSPVKKKLSLSDYTKSRMNKAAAAAAAAKPTETSLKPPTVPEGSKSPLSADVAMLDCPAADKSAEV
ncbi:PHD-finger domain-containing protein [Apiospora rasikravindrae]|uniref:PHD-finger domain-containing protein n=1 Tax=Apiospora rasikravindrae TaxID=990691 RepID=A0ABR1TYZ6_9PEZI